MKSIVAEGWSRRKRWVVGLSSALAALLLIGGTWVAASVFQSPAQREAGAKPPEPMPVLTAVRTGDLRDQLTVNGTIGSQEARTVGFGVAGGGSTVVTALGSDTAVGKPVGNGRVLLWGGDRPVITLKGSFPAYRDLKVGDSGRDVIQLQKALNAVGYGLSVDGQLGSGTMGAMTDLYRENGSQVPRVEVTAVVEAPQSGEPSKPAPKKYENVIPQAELCFIPGLEAGLRLEEVPQVGTFLDASTAKIKVATSQVMLSAEVPGQVAASLSPGLQASVMHKGAVVELVIDSITVVEAEPGEEPEGDPGQNAGATSLLVFKPAKGELPRDMPVGEPLLITVSRIVPVKDALIVPQRAITAAPDGSTTVLKLSGDGSFLPVAVKEIVCVTGECAIEAPGADLKTGEQIRVDTP